MYLMRGPRQLFFQCGTETPESWTLLESCFELGILLPGVEGVLADVLDTYEEQRIQCL